MHDRSAGDPGQERPLKRLAKAVLPTQLRGRLRKAVVASRNRRQARDLTQLRRRLFAVTPGARTQIRLAGYDITVNDGPLCYYLYKDMFIHRIYHFEARRPDPLIIDGGSNIGMSILYFKHAYPQARIIGFEPDPALLPYLHDNIKQNVLSDVRIVQAAIAGREGMLDFYADGLVGSSLVDLSPGATKRPLTKVQVSAVRLREYLTEPVDFVKLNIEGAEWEVLEDSAPFLHHVDCLAIEYHHLPGLPRTLHKILALLHDHGFEYAVSDFGVDSYGPARPPMSLNADTRYFRHVFARRI